MAVRTDVAALEQEVAQAEARFIGRLEELGYGHLFADHPAPAQLRDRLETIQDAEDRQELLDRYEDVTRRTTELTAARSLRGLGIR